MIATETSQPGTAHHVLPNTLTSGDLLQRRDGVPCRVRRTGRRDEYGQTYYKLDVASHYRNGWAMPAHTSQPYSRDQLQALGYRLAG